MGINSGPLEEQQELITAQPSLPMLILRQLAVLPLPSGAGSQRDVLSPAVPNRFFLFLFFPGHMVSPVAQADWTLAVAVPLWPLSTEITMCPLCHF